MRNVKVVIVGGGSASFGRSTICDIASCAELQKKTRLQIVLVDTDEAALDRMLNFGRVLNEYRGTEVEFGATTDRRVAFRNADYVITSVARNRMELWAQDFYVPLAYGFRHIYGENGGPGAAFHTLRSTHLMMPIVQDLEQISPGALVLNYTNPESRICLAISKLTNMKVVGICHGTQGTCDVAARVMGRRPEELVFTLGGINHFHWVLGVRDGRTGDDLLEVLDESVRKDQEQFEPLSRYLHRTFGRLTLHSDSHIGVYVGFAYDFVGTKFEEYKERYMREYISGDDQTVSRSIQIQRVADRQAPMTETLAAPTTEAAIPLIQALELDEATRFVGLNVPNTEAYVENLPRDAIAEVSVVADGKGLHPEAVGALPEGIAAMCRLQISIQNLLVEAYAERSKRALLAALLLEPTVDNADRAEQMMEELLARQANHMPSLT